MKASKTPRANRGLYTVTELLLQLEMYMLRSESKATRTGELQSGVFALEC